MAKINKVYLFVVNGECGKSAYTSKDDCIAAARRAFKKDQKKYDWFERQAPDFDVELKKKMSDWVWIDTYRVR